MYCSNCGAENDDSVAFCAKCGKNPNDVVAKDEDKNMANYPLINLSSRLFYPMFEFALWVFLIIGTIGGGVAGYWIYKAIDYRGDSAGVAAFLGVIIGFFIAFVGVIHYAGKTSIMLKANQKVVHNEN